LETLSGRFLRRYADRVAKALSAATPESYIEVEIPPE
jgi:hypothetical protein